MVEFLQAIVKARLNVLVCGGTGSGKTTMLNCLSAFIPSDERIVTIEDSAELLLQQPHVVRLETRPPNVEGKGEVTQRELVKNCLRMRPDRIIVGEVRGAEVFDMLQAMSTGHDGSIATIHANSSARRDWAARDDDAAVGRVDSAARDAPADRLGAQHDRPRQPPVRRLAQDDEDFRDHRDGRRSIMMQDLFEFVRTEIDASGKVLGHYRPTGIRSAYAQRIERAGYKLDSVMRATGTD